MKNLFIIFPAVSTQECFNCKTVIGIDTIRNNMVESRDVCGMPAVITRCPVCKTLIEWETRCN